MIVLLLIAILITLLGAWAVVAALALGGAVYVVAVGALLLLAAPILLPFHAWLDRRFAPQPPPQLARLVFEPRRDRRATAKRPSAQDGASEGDDPLMTKTTKTKMTRTPAWAVRPDGSTIDQYEVADTGGETVYVWHGGRSTRWARHAYENKFAPSPRAAAEKFVMMTMRGVDEVKRELDEATTIAHRALQLLKTQMDAEEAEGPEVTH